MIDDKKRELLKKLQALAERGEPGERDNARERLAALVEKYNISEADLSEDAVKEFSFTYHTPEQKKLLHQLFYKINGERSVKRYTHGRGSKSVLLFYGTAAEAAQIKVEYEFYCDLWQEEMEFLLSAFIQKHRIFDTKPGHKTAECDLKTLHRLVMMDAAMQDKTMQPRLTDKGV